jgi:hypothetical protein
VFSFVVVGLKMSLRCCFFGIYVEKLQICGKKSVIVLVGIAKLFNVDTICWLILQQLSDFEKIVTTEKGSCPLFSSLL